MSDEYEWTEVKVGITLTEPLGMKKSRYVWAWQLKPFVQFGWSVDGGIWPRLRITKSLEIEDYIYGDFGASKLQGLSAVLHSDGSSATYGGIDRGSPSMWSSRS